jgi:cyclic pyranopterin phosphate synthase
MLSHVKKGRPVMVPVGDKQVTHRVACALALMRLPEAVARAVRKGDIAGPKGPVVQTARLAGIMAAKQTSALIPLCHPLPLENCQIEITFPKRTELRIECTVETHHKTGVEMEALTGATVAALTVYDMCKALSHRIVIRDIRLLRKTGGRHDFQD